MIDEIEQFKAYSQEHYLCKEGAMLWAKCKGDKSLIDLSLTQLAIPYIATSIYNECGISVNYILTRFKDYINGAYISNAEYGNIKDSAALYVCEDNTQIELNVYLYHLIKCVDSVITIKDTKCPILHISNNSNLSFNFEGFNYVTIYLYDNSTINIGDIKETVTVSIIKYQNNSKVLYSLNGGEVKIKEKKLNI